MSEFFHNKSLRLQPHSQYFSFVIISLQRALMYQRTVLLNVLTNLARLVVSFYLWQAVYSSQPKLGSFDWSAMQTYVILAFVINLLFNTDFATSRVMTLIRHGDIAVELVRPTDLLRSQLAISFGSTLVEGLIGIVMAVIMGLTFIRVLPPVSFLAAILFVISVLVGFMIKFLINYIVSLLCFWTKNMLGLSWAQAAIVSFCSGALIPLDLLSAQLKSILQVLPFQAILYTPLMIYLGNVKGYDIIIAIAIQVLWVVALWLLARVAWYPCLRALDIQGG